MPLRSSLITAPGARLASASSLRAQIVTARSWAGLRVPVTTKRRGDGALGRLTSLAGAVLGLVAPCSAPAGCGSAAAGPADAVTGGLFGAKLGVGAMADGDGGEEGAAAVATGLAAAGADAAAGDWPMTVG